MHLGLSLGLTRLARTSGGGGGTPDTTAPTLSSPTGTQTGSTTGTSTVSTNEANGTIYAFLSTSATPPTAANLKTGTGAVSSASQAVSATGVQTVNWVGLTASTTYYTHWLHRDAAGNDSAIVSGAGFTPAGATITAPILTQTSTAGTNPLTWDATYTNVQTGDVVELAWTLNGVAGAGETHTLTDQDIIEASSGSYTLPWTNFRTAIAGGGAVTAKERINRSGVTPSLYSNVLTDTVSAAAATVLNSVFDPASKESVINLSTTTLTNDTATSVGTAGYPRGVRVALAAKTSGNWVFALKIDALGTGAEAAYSVAANILTSGHSLQDVPGWPGGDANSVALYSDHSFGLVNNNVNNGAGGPALSAGSALVLAIQNTGAGTWAVWAGYQTTAGAGNAVTWNGVPGVSGGLSVSLSDITFAFFAVDPGASATIFSLTSPPSGFTSI